MNGTEGTDAGGVRREPRRRRRRLFLVVAAVVAGALLLGGTYLGAVLYKIGGVQKEPLRGLGARPVATGTALNILLIGSDSRAGENAQYGAAEGQRGDVTLLLHVSGDRQRATAISIPRDSAVQIPACERADGSIVPAGSGQFNSAFARGGASCTIKTLESLTDVRVDHFVQVDFTGFKAMVDALGSVDICLPRSVDDDDSGLRLPAGRHSVNGETALAYVRVRHGLGDGSDLSRIKRQQAFLAAMVQKATSAGILANPRRTLNFLDAIAESMITDEGFSTREMASLATTVRGIGLPNITFLTVPNEPYPANPNWVQWSPDASAMWAAVRSDSPLDKPAPRPKSVPTVPTTVQAGTPSAPLPPSAVRVRVLNGTPVKGKAAEVADALRARGFQVEEVGNADRANHLVGVVRHGPGYGESGRTVSLSVPGTRTELVPDAGRVVDLILGANSATVVDVPGAAPTAAAKPAPDLDVRRADEDVCG